MASKYRIQSIVEFLEAQSCKVDLYSPNLEVQVNVLPGKDKVKVEGKKAPQWTDGVEAWSAFRIPYGGSGIDAEPHYTDGFLGWTFERHVEAIGLTGWDWKSRVSRWVGFDFDSIANHNQGLSDKELDDLRYHVRKIPWIELRRSKSGKGYHLYVYFENPVSTRNHTEHAALARSILSHLSGLLSFKFEDKVDTSGGILWIWHRDGSNSKRSFEIIKSASEKLTHIPDGWKDYINVRRRRSRVPSKLADSEDQFNDLLSRTRSVALDSEHKALLKWFASKDQTAWWDAEKGMLVCHTSALREAHNDLNLKGVFETIATGRETGDHNCFCFPNRSGSWGVFRYSLGTPEHKYWTKTPNGWTSCIYNRLPDLASASRLFDGVKTKKGEFRFKTFRKALEVIHLLGAVIETEDVFLDRPTILAPGKAESEIVVTVPYKEGDPPLANWYREGRTKDTKRWECIVNSIVEAKIIEPPDEAVRHVTRPEGKPAWFVLSRGRWVEKGKDDIRSALEALDYTGKEISKLLGMAVLEDWEEVVLPFQAEYPGNRRWNRHAPQFAHEPSYGRFPTWELILNHVGSGLAVDTDEWCRINHINTGGDYLKLWLASMFRHPFEPLPYLFFWSEEQNTGKSSLHEAVQLLLKNGIGYTKADRALTSSSGFNGELYGAILAVVEEVNVSSKIAFERIKDWVTSPNLFIRPVGEGGFLSPNSTHWIQCSNNRSYCPVFPGDTRITVGHVGEFTGDEIPKRELMGRLVSEGPAFVHSLLGLEIPASSSRLRIPVLDSDTKRELEDLNRSALTDFLELSCEHTPGTVLSFDIFVSTFIQQLPPDEQHRWDRKKIIRELPPGKFPRGNYANRTHIGNISISGVESKKLKETDVQRNGRKLI